MSDQRSAVSHLFIVTLLLQVSVMVCGAGRANAVGPLAQVFPPRQSSPAQSPQQSAPANPAAQAPAPPPRQPALIPAMPAQPQPFSRVLPFAAIVGGDFSKSFVQLGNLRGPLDSEFVIGRGLAGHIRLERHLADVANGNKVLVHVSGLSNPPTATSEGGELRLQYTFPSLQFKGFYKDYSNEGDGAIPDVVSEKATIDIYFKPITDPRGLPTYQSVWVVFNAELKEPEKCRAWFDLIFPVNVCAAAKDYIKQLKPAIENGLRDSLQHPNARTQFDQAVWPYLRAELLTHAGINPASPAQLQIVHAEVRGADYTVSYLPRP